MDKIRWGILSTAKIGREKVIPAMQNSTYCSVSAIASRKLEQAEEVAAKMHIPKAYGSYEELINDVDIDAVYIPLPNHMHVEWAKKAIAANKHVLCEKPIALSAEQAKELFDFSQQKPQLKIMEAFMYRFHPQWERTKKLLADGNIGQLRTVQCFFSYFNDDLNNIRNKKEAGGGSLMDIGCYCVSFARYLFEEEPTRVLGRLEYDERSQTDKLSTGILDFSTGTASFTCSTQLMPHQRVNIIGTTGRIEIEIPVNAPPDQTTRIWLHSKDGSEEISFEPINQYTVQADSFSKAILDNTHVPTGLADAVNNMKVIDAIFKSSKNNAWQNV